MFCGFSRDIFEAIKISGSLLVNVLEVEICGLKLGP